MTVKKNDLKERMYSVFSKIPKNKWSYFHKRSMDNFIYHLTDFEDQELQAKLKGLIENYLEDIEMGLENGDIEINIEMSEYLYKNYLSKLIQPFDFDLAFVPVFGRKAYLLIIPFVVAIGYVFWFSKVIITIILVVLGLWYGRIAIKAFSRKVYGFGY